MRQRMKINREVFFRHLGAKVLYYRTALAMNQDELARQAHISQGTLSRIENGKYNDNLSVALLLDIAEALRILPQRLLEFHEEEQAQWLDPDGQ